MGCVQSSAVDEEAKARKCLPSFPGSPSCCLRLFSSATLTLGNEEIENQLRRDKVMAKNEIKMLLLGAGESGKVRPFTQVVSTDLFLNEISLLYQPSPLFSSR
jgi:guanine nucleotide-binding protein G(i) subunit alpha